MYRNNVWNFKNNMFMGNTIDCLEYFSLSLFAYISFVSFQNFLSSLRVEFFVTSVVSNLLLVFNSVPYTFRYGYRFFRSIVKKPLSFRAKPKVSYINSLILVLKFRDSTFEYFLCGDSLGIKELRVHMNECTLKP